MSFSPIYHLYDWIPKEKINFEKIKLNINHIYFIDNNLSLCKVDWYQLSSNENAIYLLEKKLDKVNWSNLSANENAIHLLEKNLDKVNINDLSKNHNAIYILEKHLDKVDWVSLSENPNAISIIEKNKDKLDNKRWITQTYNPSIFILDKKEMMKQCKPLAEELSTYVFHPNCLMRFSKKYNVDLYILLELY